MKIVYKTSFERDVKKCEAIMLHALKAAIENIEAAKSFQEISNLKKLKGHKLAYRIRVNNYRLCLFFEDDIVRLVRFLPRKSVYQFFP